MKTIASVPNQLRSDAVRSASPTHQMRANRIAALIAIASAVRATSRHLDLEAQNLHALLDGGALHLIQPGEASDRSKEIIRTHLDRLPWVTPRT